MVYADLHSHTTVSDGETKPEEVVELAKEVGLDAVAVTDHDRVNPLADAPLQVINGVDVISGIELRVETQDGERIDLLGYGVTETTELMEITEEIKTDRIERAERMIDLIEEETGVKLEFQPEHNTGRPHIARAIENNKNLKYSYDEAFENLIGNDCPCYTPRDIPSFREGISVLKECTEFLSLAHPFRYDSPEKVLQLAKQLDGVEYKYPYNSDLSVNQPLLDTIIADFNLTVTGGSDSHKKSTLGIEGLNKEQYITFLQESELQRYSHL